MPDSLTMTFIFIILAGLAGIFAKGRSRDKCLRDFSKDTVTFELIDGKQIKGRLIVETTGCELLFGKLLRDQEGHQKASYLFYKNEYPLIRLVIRFLDDLNQQAHTRRIKDLKRTYHPCWMRRAQRRTMNFFKTLRDALMDLVNMVMVQAQSRFPGSRVPGAQEKYVSRIKQDMMATVNTAYEPLLERHIGAKVVFEIKKGEVWHEYAGILKDYSQDFIEILDVLYKAGQADESRKADILLARQHGFVRYLGEEPPKTRRRINFIRRH